MENSVTKDYATEKLYDALVAGCVPIYLGHPNIADFVPEESAIINYAQLGSPQALQAELERLAGDEQAYAAKLEWKTKDTKLWNAGWFVGCACEVLAMAHAVVCCLFRMV